MTALTWDAVGNRTYETGVDKGVLYIPDNTGAYTNGVAWNGLTQVSEAPTGAAATPMFADNIKYLNLIGTEEFGATIDCYTYPDEWQQFDGLSTPEAGVAFGQQPRGSFGLSYRTAVGDDLKGLAHGYKLHMIYGATAAPSAKVYKSVNDTPDAITFSYTITTVAHAVTGHSPTSTIVIDSSKVDPTALAALESLLYGTVGTNPTLPTPDAVLALFSGTVTQVDPVAPTYVSGTHTLTIPTVAGITYYYSDGSVVTAGAHVITSSKFVTARPNAGYILNPTLDSDWSFVYV